MSAPLDVAGVNALEEQIADLAADGWDQDDETGRFEWEDFLNRVERYLDVELPGQMDDPAVKRVQAIARKAAREARIE